MFIANMRLHFYRELLEIKPKEQEETLLFVEEACNRAKHMVKERLRGIDEFHFLSEFHIAMAIRLFRVLTNWIEPFCTAWIEKGNDEAPLLLNTEVLTRIIEYTETILQAIDQP